MMNRLKEARVIIGGKTKSLDILINNAGIYGGYPQSAFDATVEQFKSSIRCQCLWRGKSYTSIY